MSHPTDDPLEEGASRVAQLASLAISSVETVVRLSSVRGRHAPGASVATREDDIDVDDPAPEAAAREGQRLQEAGEATLALTAPAMSKALAREPFIATSPAIEPPATKTGAPRSAPGASTSGGGGRSVWSAEELLGVHRDAQAFFRRGVEASWVPGYLSGRRLECALDEPWGAGYAPAGWTALTDHLRRRGWSDEVLLASGLSRRARTGNLIDHFRDRLVLPVYGHRDIIGFVGRCAEGADELTPRYLNSPRTDVYDKSSVLFGLNGLRGADWAASPTLVEGPLDAIAVTSSSRRHVGLAACGTALTPGHIATLAKAVPLSQRLVVVATDHDAAGDTAAVKAYGLLSGRCAYQHRLVLPVGQDPAGVLHDVGPGGLATLLDRSRVPLLDVAIDARLAGFGDQLQWIEGRVKAARAIAPILASLTRPDREAAIEALAERLDLLPSTVNEAVNQVLRKWIRLSGASAGPENADTLLAQSSAAPHPSAQRSSRAHTR